MRNTPDAGTRDLRSDPFAAQAALYASQGHRVFPVAPIGQGARRADGKEPYPGTHGFKDATNDLDQIAEWSEHFPDANIGLACEASGLVVLDVDLDLDDPKQSDRWDQFCKEHQIPLTLTQRTAGGGQHYIFEAEPGVKYPGSVSDTEGKIADMKHKGYILLAPSVAQSGRRDAPGTYEVVDDAPPAPAPDWLKERVSGRTNSGEPESPLAQLKLDVREHRRKEDSDRLLNLLQSKRNTIKSRDDWLRLGFALHAGYVGTRWEQDAYAAWIEFSERWEAPKGTRMADFAENAAQVWTNATANTEGGVMPATAQKLLQELPDLPYGDIEAVLPVAEGEPTSAKPIRLSGLAGRIAGLVRLASDRQLEVLPEGAALAAMSALAAPSFVIRGPQGKTSLNIYMLLLGGTGSGKEAGRKAADTVLHAARRRDELLASIASDIALHRALTRGGEPGTTSGGSRGARVMATDESGLHLDAIRKGANGHQKSLLALLMSLFGLGQGRLPPHKYADDRREIEAVEHPRVTLIWTSTPEAFEKATGQEDSESGQMNRFLVFREHGFPPLRPGEVNRDVLSEPPEDVTEAARKFPARTLEQVVASQMRDSSSDRVVEMTHDAVVALEAFRTGEVEEQRQRGGLEGESWARAAEYALRVAGLLALSDAALDPSFVTLDEVTCKRGHVDLAIEIVRRSTYGVVDLAKNAGKGEIEQIKDKVLATIGKLAEPDGYAQARDVHRGCLRGVQTQLRDGIIKSMVEDGEIIREDRQTGGRTGVYYALAVPRKRRRLPEKPQT